MRKTALLRKTFLQTAILLLLIPWIGLAKERRQADVTIPLGKDHFSHIRVEITNFAPHEAPHLDIQIQGEKANPEPISLGKQYGNEITLSLGDGKEVRVKIRQEGEETIYEVTVIGIPELEGTQEIIKVKTTEEGYEVEADGKRIRFQKLPDGRFVKVEEQPVEEQGKEDKGKEHGAEQMTVKHPPDLPQGDIIPEHEPPPVGDAIPEQKPQIGTVDPIPPQEPLPPGDPIPEWKPQIGTIDPIPPQELPPWVPLPVPRPGVGPRGGVAAGVTINPSDFQSQ